VILKLTVRQALLDWEKTSKISFGKVFFYILAGFPKTAFAEKKNGPSFNRRYEVWKN
jgi:hypothetical protein